MTDDEFYQFVNCSDQTDNNAEREFTHNRRGFDHGIGKQRLVKVPSYRKCKRCARSQLGPFRAYH